MTERELLDKTEHAVTSILSTMFGMNIDQATPLTPADGMSTKEEVVAIVGIAGVWNGTGTVRCPAATACLLAGKMLMAEYSEINVDVLDVMGEIANMVVGSLKSELEDRTGPLGLSIPTVFYGRNFCMRSVGVDPVAIQFQSEGHDFRVDLALAQSSGETEWKHHRGAIVHPI